jgi:hypothetical protein
VALAYKTRVLAACGSLDKASRSVAWYCLLHSVKLGDLALLTAVTWVGN